MAVTLMSLIKVAPFPEDQKKLLLEKMDQMTDQDKFELTDAAWQALAIQYFGKLKAECQRLNGEAVANNKPLNPNDFEEIEAKLLHEFTQKLEAAESQESIEEVRQKLKTYQNKS